MSVFLVSDVVLLHGVWLLDIDFGDSHLWSHYPIDLKSCSTYNPITTAHLLGVLRLTIVVVCLRSLSILTLK